jgi:YjbE family integral membrane protein
MEFLQLAFWIAVLKIIWINILLSGDNAVVIALACRNLPPRQRAWGMVIGAGVASVLLILFTAIIATLITFPYLRLVGGGALFWIAFKLLVPADVGAQGHIEAVDGLWRAVKIVVVADIVMSLDNVIAVAAAAKGSYWMLGLGLAVSIPIVIAGSALIIALLERFPALVWAGAALLGWIAGELLSSDPVVERLVSATTDLTLVADSSILGAADRFRFEVVLNLVELGCALTGALGVVATSAVVVRSRRSAKAQAQRDRLEQGVA